MSGAIVAREITKYCDDGRAAIDRVDARFETGKLTLVCGENGAGKSTLLRAIAGLIVRARGTVSLEDDGKITALAAGAEAALAAGLCMVQQHLALVPVFDAIENFVLMARGGLVDRRALGDLLQRTLNDLGFSVPLNVPVGKLSVAERQRLEIARAIAAPTLRAGAANGARLRLLALDEPTAVLTPREADGLYEVLQGVASAGTAVVVVTHKLDEVQKFADHVLVLRRGLKVHDAPFVRDADAAVDARRALIDEVAAAMLGAAYTKATAPARAPRAAGAAPLLVAEHLALGPLRDGSFRVAAGEILGIAGVEGNGQGELVSILAGLAERGTWSGQVTPPPSAVSAIFPDRHDEGLVLEASVEDNLLLGSHGAFTRAGFLRTDALREEALRRAKMAGAPTDLSAPATAFSGGNQQKIVVARALAKEAQVLVAAHPTRGVDVAAAAAIHKELRAWVSDSTLRRDETNRVDSVQDAPVSASVQDAPVSRCALVISADLDELRTLADRIVVLAHGAIVGEFSPTASDAELGAAMLSTQEIAP